MKNLISSISWVFRPDECWTPKNIAVSQCKLDFCIKIKSPAQYGSAEFTLALYRSDGDSWKTLISLFSWVFCPNEGWTPKNIDVSRWTYNVCIKIKSTAQYEGGKFILVLYRSDGPLGNPNFLNFVSFSLKRRLDTKKYCCFTVETWCLHQNRVPCPV